MELLKEYFRIQQEIYDYFGYEEDWVVIPLEDDTEYYWQLTSYQVCFAETQEELQSGKYYENEIYTQRFLDKYVYRGKDYTMVCVDTNTDGNKFLMVLDNKKERS